MKDFALWAGLGSAAGGLLAALIVPFLLGNRALQRSFGFGFAMLMSLVFLLTGIQGLGQAPVQISLPGPIPLFPWQFLLDPLASFFLAVLGLVGFAASLHGLGYFRSLPARQALRVLIPYPLFLGSMALVLLAANAYTFLVAWELMALSSSFLILVDPHLVHARKAVQQYLLIAHVGALCLIAAFFLLSRGSGTLDLNFTNLAHTAFSPGLANIVFLLSLIGFGAKLGILPLHIWLPEAHPAAPAPVSALMSAAMLPIALYGLLRMDWQILHLQGSWWGPLCLALGLLGAAFAVLFSAVQNDMKRLLAYSSMENMGLILVGIGLAEIFSQQGMNTLAALALTAALFQVLNHALFKGLLFLGSGSVLHATGTVQLSQLGGLNRSMPQTAFLVFIGVLAMAGLPPLNGFASEWLLLQAFLLAPGMATGLLQVVLPLAAAVVVLVLAIAGLAVVKLYGIGFLGLARATTAHAEASLWERLAMGFFAVGCVLFGLFPGLAVDAIAPITHQLLPGKLLAQPGIELLTPISPSRASYSPGVFFLGITVAILITFLLVWWRFGRPWRRAPVWACGFAGPTTPRMQDSASGFSQPLLRIFTSILRPSDQQDGSFQVTVREPFWDFLYVPLISMMYSVAARVLRLQHGRITLYLMYAFLTLVFLLILVLWGFHL